MMDGDEVLENADIVVTDNRITAIGRSGRLDISSDALRVDVRELQRSCLLEYL